MTDQWNMLLSIGLGIGLAAACGLRVFLPLFIASLLAHFDLGDVGLRTGFGWLAEWPAMIALGVATVAELLAYYIPLVDHALDAVAVPLSTIAGTLVAMSSFVDVPPMPAWGLALIAGGGVAGLISAGTAATRLASTVKTGGLGNPVVATAETGGAIALSVIAWFLPFVALVLVLALVVVVVRWLLARKRRMP